MKSYRDCFSISFTNVENEISRNDGGSNPNTLQTDRFEASLDKTVHRVLRRAGGYFGARERLKGPIGPVFLGKQEVWGRIAGIVRLGVGDFTFALSA